MLVTSALSMHVCHGTAHVQERRYSAHDAYSTSKLAMMLITAEQAQRLGSSGPTSNCLDPGTVNTKLLYAGALAMHAVQ